MIRAMATISADLDTIRECLKWANADIRAALDRLAGCVILTREEAEMVRRGLTPGSFRIGNEVFEAVTLLDARLDRGE